MELEWYRVLKNNLEPGDEIRKIYAGKLDGNIGYLCLSNRKLMFVKAEGFMHNIYDLTLDQNYDEIILVFCEGKFNLIISEIGGSEHKFYSFDVPASAVERSFEQITIFTLARNYL